MGGEAAVLFCRAGYGSASAGRGRRTMSVDVECESGRGGGEKRVWRVVQRASPWGDL